MILLIDNYDSFVYNLSRYIQELGKSVKVVRNDAITLDWIERYNPSQIIISPGPCTPLESGLSNEVIRNFGPHIPILGVCLGHQCIASVFGAQVCRARYPIHGKTDLVSHDNQGLFKGLPNPLQVTRYHSLIVRDVPNCLKVTAYSMTTDEIMALRHQTYPITGVQFHPESVLTVGGYQMLSNFLNVPCELEVFQK